jgi:hypothetical protein
MSNAEELAQCWTKQGLAEMVCQLEAENAELLKDRERLEWLAINFFGYVVTPEGDRWSLDGKSFFSDWRGAIDEAMGGE